MPKYLLTNVYNYDNQGEMAQVMGLVQNLKGAFVVVPMCSSVNKAFCDKLGIKVVGRLKPLPKPLFIVWLLFLSLRALLYSVLPLNILLNRELRAYRDCDMILDLSGDTFSDDPHPLQTVLHCFQLLPAIFLHKPYILVSQSVGMFRTYFTKRLACYILRYAKLIIAREYVTVNYLVDKLKIDKNKVQCAIDVGFLLRPQQLTIHHYIGVNVSQIIGRWMRKSGDYINLMVKLVDKMAENNKVILIPHVTGEGYALGNNRIHDDRIIAHQIYKRLQNHQNVNVINKVYDTDYTKGIIAKCDCFVGARFHACLAAISQGIPTIMLAYSHKALGMASLINKTWVQVIDVREKSLDFLLTEIYAKAEMIDG